VATRQERRDWTSADLEAARLGANSATPRRLGGRTPAEVWAGRPPLAQEKRVSFQPAVERNRYLVRNDWNIAQEEILDHWQNARLDRQAIERALVEHDYLLFRGRRIPLTIIPGKVTYFV
jgi:hypothetical protein